MKIILLIITLLSSLIMSKSTLKKFKMKKALKSKFRIKSLLKKGEKEIDDKKDDG